MRAMDAGLFTRELGERRPVVVLHGGPDFDHSYLLPELDLLARSYRLVYYDQRGRGRSAGNVRPEDVTMRTELDDVEAVRRGTGAERVAVLGHSWGGLLALEYALRHPDRVSHLILLNTAPASHADFLRLRSELAARREPADAEAMAALAAGEAFRAGDVEADAAYHRLHFKPALHRPELVGEVVSRLRRHFTPETILLARAIEHRLQEQTWLREDYDLLPRLRRLDVPALVLHGEQDFIPVEVAANVAGAIPEARLRVLPRCGHFSYLEAPEAVGREIASLLR
jgi:proline iminopeptidase